MQKRDNKIGNKTAYKEERQIKGEKRAREKDRNRFAKKNKSKFWLVRMPKTQQGACKESRVQ